MTPPLPESIIEAAFPHTSIQITTTYDSRATNGVCELTTPTHDDPLILKYTADARWRLQKEATVLTHLQPIPEIPVPTVIEYGPDTHDQWTYLLTTEATGTPVATQLKPSSDDIAQRIESIGATLAHLHANTSFPRAGAINPHTDSLTLTDSPRTWDELLRTLLEAEHDILEDTGFEASANAVRDAFETHHQTIIPVKHPSLLYCDANPANILVTDDTITAVLDWEYAKVGDPVYDLTAAERRLIDDGPAPDTASDSLYTGYTNHRSLPPDADTRRDVYRAILTLDRMVSLCVGSETTTPPPDVADTPEGRSLRRRVDQRIDALPPQ